jgi:ornithine cyclodeaminase
MEGLFILSHSDITQLYISQAEILKLVEESIAGIGNGASLNPPKISIKPAESGMTIAMLAQYKTTAALGIKAYTEFPAADGRTLIGSVITLFDQASGTPLAFMDGQWITVARTAAVTALFAREAPHARMVLLIGAGAQARAAIPQLLDVCPSIELISIRAARQESAERLIAEHDQRLRGRSVRVCTDLIADAAGADIVIGAAGPGGHGLVRHGMLKQGAMAILVGYGLAPDILQKADRVISTSEAQMHVTGQDLADAAGRLPAVDAELHEILLRRKVARTGPQDIIFAYNSGLAVTDVAVAGAVYAVARKAGIGSFIAGF